MDKQDFNELVSLAMQQPGLATMRPVIEKELLHYDIFQALDNANLLKDLVFQGGTSLRLCRGSSRLSEDIDFAGGKDFSSAKMQAIKSCIEKHIGDRYGLAVEVREPKEMTLLPDYNGIKVDKWQVSVETAPAQRDTPRQLIKIEIANIPAYTRELVPLRLNYEFLRGYGSVLVNAESLDEIMADKLIAFPVAKNIRYWDIWDLAWLEQQGARVDYALVQAKRNDYRIDGYLGSLKQARESLPDLVHGKGFKDQMLRFIDAETISRTLDQPQFLGYLTRVVGSLFADVHAKMAEGPGQESEPEFRM
jgi:predicted nucleotidyltransferase component of viral defense system